MIPDVFLYRGYCLIEEKDNNTNELEELMLEEIDINEDSDESDDFQNLTDPVVTPATTTPAVVASSTAGSATAAAASTATSPKTGDAFPYVLALAAMCFAGAALCIRKSSLTK